MGKTFSIFKILARVPWAYHGCFHREFLRSPIEVPWPSSTLSGDFPKPKPHQ